MQIFSERFDNKLSSIFLLHFKRNRKLKRQIVLLDNTF
jgi:hypothetical protein